MKSLLFLFNLTSALECSDKRPELCNSENVDCSSKVTRLFCPKTCKLCERMTQLTAQLSTQVSNVPCLDSGKFCDVMPCSSPAAAALCRKSCNLCGTSSSSQEAVRKPSFSGSSSASSSLKCVDTNVFCNPNLCSTWSKAQAECRKTCNPSCQKITTTKSPKTRPVRTTRPPRTKPTKAPKANPNSPCQDNPTFAGMCGGGLSQLNCNSLLGKMYCARSCGLCAGFDKMFECRDKSPSCTKLHCSSMLLKVQCQKTCGSCMSLAQINRQANSKMKNPKQSKNSRTASLTSNSRTASLTSNSRSGNLGGSSDMNQYKSWFAGFARPATSTTARPIKTTRPTTTRRTIRKTYAKKTTKRTTTTTTAPEEECQGMKFKKNGTFILPIFYNIYLLLTIYL